LGGTFSSAPALLGCAGRIRRSQHSNEPIRWCTNVTLAHLGNQANVTLTPLDAHPNVTLPAGNVTLDTSHVTLTPGSYSST
jgi:hypothetical protein